MKRLILTLVICLGCFGFLEAQNIWKPINGTGILGAGPDGSIYAYSENGKLARSQDEGETWQIVLGQETGFSGFVNQLCFAVSPEGRVFVFNDNQQTVVYSNDGGDTWQQTSVLSLCGMPTKTGICAPTNDIVVVWSTNGEIHWTTDGGATWSYTILGFLENSESVSNLLVNENGDVYVSVSYYIMSIVGIYHATLSDMESWGLAAFDGVSIKDMAFDPEGNVVACGYHIDGSSIGFQHTPGFYLFDGTTLAISDGGIVYRPHFVGNQAILSYSTDHGEHFTDIGEHIPLVDIAPGGDAFFLIKGYDNNLYFDGGGEYWKCILDADEIISQHRPFAPQGAEWYFNMFDPWSTHPHYVKFYVSGDTVVQGHSCSVINTQFIETGHDGTELVYEENNKVYWFNPTNNNFTILYDFDAEVGDSWYCEVDSCSHLVTVESVENVTWNGHTYRTQWIKSYEDDIVVFDGRIIEGIGYEKGLFPFNWACHGDIWFDYGELDYLRCYVEDGEILYHEGNYDCDYVYVNTFCWDGTVAEAYDGGDGTEENPYQIANAQQLALLAQQTNDGTGGDAYYKLTANINLERCTGGYNTWTSIGVPENETTPRYFTGHFDGGGNNILNLYQRHDATFKGLFGCTNGAEIKDVNMVYCAIGNGAEYAGGLVGYAGSTDISNCNVQNSNVTTTGGVAGGIVGYAGMPFGTHETNENVSKITNCKIELVTVESSVDAGGIVGKINDDAYYARYLVSNCVTFNEQYYHIKGSVAGGIVGEMRSGAIEGCANRSIVVGEGQVSNVCVGGIAGSIHGSSVIANSYNRYYVVANYWFAGFAGGIVGYSAGDIYNVYNVGEIYLPDPNSSGYGNIVGNVQSGERLNCYWLENDLPSAGNPILPDMPGSTSFHQGSTATSWVLTEPQYGTVDLVEALNAGASEIESLYPEIGPLSRWEYDVEEVNDGFPVLVPNDSEDDELESYCEAPFNFGGSPIAEQGTYGAQLWWNKPFASHWFHYDEKPYEGSAYCNYWGIKIPAEEIQAGDVLTHVAFYKAGGQNQVADYAFGFGIGGETEPDNLEFLPGNEVQIEPGPDGWVMVKLSHSINCEEGKSLWIVLHSPNVEGNNASYCQASGNPNACWSSEGNVAGDWMIRGYFTNDLGYNEPGYNAELDHYNIYRGRTLEEMEKIAEVGRDEEEYFDTLQTPFGDYYYQLTAAYTDGRESAPARRGENPHDPDFVYFHVGNISSLGSEWYYEILNENGSITYQHLEYAADTTVNGKDVKIIIRTNTLYDKGRHSEVTREYIYEDFGKVYWWNNELQDFTLLYDLGAQIGDSWDIHVGTETLTLHVDLAGQYEEDGTVYRVLRVSDANDLFSGEIMSGIGHLTSFFPERLMTRGKDYRVEGIRCYWREGELVFKYGDEDCDAVYEEIHNGIEKPVEAQFNVYPNPTNDILVVETQCLASQLAEYRITNLMGQTLMTGQITAETQRIDVSKLSAGMYFISVGDVTRRFVVNK